MFEIGRRLIDGIWQTGPADESAGGGSQPSPWVGPYPFSFADYNPALGSGWDGILIENALTAGMLLLAVAFIVDVTFTSGGANVQVYAGTLAGDDFNTPNLSTDIAAYGGVLAVARFTSGAINDPAGAGALVTGVDVSQVWIDGFSGTPDAGSGRLWLNLVTPDAPA